MNTETRELRDEELDRVSGGIDIGGAAQTVCRVTIGLINAGLNTLTSGGGSGSGGVDRGGGVVDKRQWL
jgi:hypothetical protein